jgi:hypothetical protein
MHTKNCCIKNPNGKHKLCCFFYINDFFSKKNQNLNFKVPQANCFWAILTIVGSYGHFWANSVAMAMTNNIPQFI